MAKDTITLTMQDKLDSYLAKLNNTFYRYATN